MDKSLEPKTISDVLDNAEGYIAEMRQKHDKVAIPQGLKGYIWKYFRETDMSKAIIEKLACFSVDKICRIASVLTIADEYTYTFFSEVMTKLWESIQGRGVDTFYILDNEMREDRFKLNYDLYRLSGFAVVTPYFENVDVDKDALKTDKEKTVNIVMDPPFTYEYFNFEAVDAQIKKHMKSIRNIVYMEKDSRVNYIDKVIDIGKNSNHLCIFRNVAPTDDRVQIIKSKYPHQEK